MAGLLGTNITVEPWQDGVNQKWIAVETGNLKLKILRNSLLTTFIAIRSSIWSQLVFPHSKMAEVALATNRNAKNEPSAP